MASPSRPGATARPDTTLTEQLATWALALEPTADDRALAQRALLDTVAVTIAGREHPLAAVTAHLSEQARWASIGHVLDYDDLHLPSTAHVSVVCVPATLAAGGGETAYLAAAGVMARLGTALGWEHYEAGWHATCTAGAPAAAVAAGLSWGLTHDQLCSAIALAVPGAGGVQRAFGSDAKALQVGFAVHAGLRAARLARSGARADPAMLDAWWPLVTATPPVVDLGGPAVPDGLAVKVYPACYALQRPIAALSGLTGDIDPDSVSSIRLSTPAATVAPLIHHRPVTGLQGKFSLEYAAAAALLDRPVGFASFTDEAVARPQAQRLLRLVEVELTPGGRGLLDGEIDVQVHLTDGAPRQTSMRFPPGSPQRPAGQEDLWSKLEDCLSGTHSDPSAWSWASAAQVLRDWV